MKTSMTPRERVTTALSLQEPDRVPIDLGQAAGDGITLSAYRNLIRHLGMPERPIGVQKKRLKAEFGDRLGRYPLE